MKRLLVYLKEYKKESILGPLFKLLEASFELLVPLVMAAIIDQGIAGNNQGYVLKMGAVLVALGLIGLVCSLTAQFFAARAAVGFAARVRHALFAHIQRLSYTELDTLGTSSLITRMTSDIQQMQSGVNLTLRLLLRSPFIVFGSVIMAFTVDAASARIFLLVVPLLAVVVFGIMLFTMPLYKKAQSRLDQVTANTRETLAGVRVVRAFHQESQEVQRFHGSTAALLNMQIFAGKISALMNPLTYVLVNLSLIALLRSGAIRVDGGLLSQGAVVALVNYLSQILVELVKLANLIITMTKAAASAGRVADILDIPSSLALAENGETQGIPSAPAVCFEDVSLTYQNAGAPSLNRMNFSVSAGETFGIIGGTGCGKSSLVQLIPRFYDATQGHVLVKGVDVKSWDLQALREKIGVVPQKASLFEGTLRENLLWGNRGATDAQLLEALSTAQALDILEKKDGGLDLHVQAGGRNFSGGQRQRLTIARALVRRPDILIFDDSSSALDFATEARLLAALKQLPGHPTIFIVSQRASSLMHASQILVLEDGEPVGLGSHAELLASCPVYQEIYEAQFPKEAE